jgi:hypothetical protein
MAKNESDKFSRFDAVLEQADVSDPWGHTAGQTPVYVPDYELLGRLLTLPVEAGAVSESGSFPAGIDSWIAHELRRAGFGADEVWPRPVRPRILPRDVAVLIERLPMPIRLELAWRIQNLPAVGPVDARILGRAYVKRRSRRARARRQPCRAPCAGTGPARAPRHPCGRGGFHHRRGHRRHVMPGLDAGQPCTGTGPSQHADPQALPVRRGPQRFSL